MKIFNNILKASLASLALLSTVTVSAVNRIYVEPLTVSNYEVAELKVMVECDEPVNGVTLDLWIPEGLSFANGNNSFTKDAAYKDFNLTKFQVGAQHQGDHFAKLFFAKMPLKNIEAGIHQIGTISVKAEENVLAEPSVKQMKFNSEVTFPGETVTSETVKDQTANVTFGSAQGTLNITFSQPEMVLNPLSPRELRLGMENSMNCVSFQLTLEVPAGVSISDAEPLTDRVPEGTYFVVQKSQSGDNDYNLVTISFEQGGYAINGHSGDFVKMNLTADDEFNAENAILRIKNIVLGSDNTEGFYGQDVTMTVTAGKLAYERAAAAIEELNQKLTTAMNTVNEQYPLAAEVINPMDVYQQISALQSAVETAYENYTLTPNYDEVMAPVAAIEAAIDEYVEKCRVENERQTTNKAAYDAVVAQLNTLQEQYDAAIATVTESYPDFRDAEAEAAAQKLITDAKSAAQAAYEAVETEGNFTYSPDTDAISAAIAALVTDAKARHDAEMARRAANQEAYNDVVASLDALQEQLDTTLATLAEDYADFRDTDAEAAAQQMITDAKAAAQAALEAVAEEGNFDYTPDTESIAAAIAKLLTDAEARRAAELDRVQANETAHNAVIAQLDELQAQLDAAMATLAEKYPTFRDEDAEQAAQQMITDAKAAADAAFEAVAEEGVYNYTPDVEAITVAVTSLVPDAEQRRVDYNNNLYDQDIATVDHLQELYDQAMADIKALRPDFEGDANTSNVQEMIQDARNQCDEELARVEEEGLYEAPAFDAEQVESAIQAMKDNAISGISDIYVDYNGEEVIIFTMDGTRHNKPVVGQVNIFRYKNGKCVKTFVNK